VLYVHKVNHKFLSDVEPEEQDICLAEGNEGTESDRTTLDFAQTSSLKETCAEVLRVT